jgi:hypothetical protein
MVSQIFQALVYFSVCAVLILVGWEQPLRYRFLSPEQIAEIERPTGQSVAGAMPKSTQWRPMGTSLDRAPYETHNQGVIYTNNIDGLEMGTRSEQEAKANLYNGRGAQ